ncbi:MAG: hypothetical protein KGJ07_04170 [Patescibacteria group bacterium]|nr:hypothetical protein [Patescibacteria group bacterium]
MKPQKTALVVGLFVGGFHLLWSVLVLLGFGQPLLDFIYWLHFLANPFIVAPFDITRALLLIIVTFLVGYTGGWCFALLWNKSQVRK